MPTGEFNDVIVVSIPKSELNSSAKGIALKRNTMDTEYYLNPEYIEGYVKIDVESGALSDIIYNIKSKNYSKNVLSDGTDELFENISANEFVKVYGVDQGILDRFYYFETPDGTKISSTNKKLYNEYVEKGIVPKMVKGENYDNIKNTIMEKYKLSNIDAERFISSLDSIGACTYADQANNIIAHFKNDPSAYESIFGFPLYRTASNGKQVLNGEELLVDMFYWMNSMENGGAIFMNLGGTHTMNPFLVESNFQSAKLVGQTYVSKSTGIDNKLLDGYLKSKSPDVSVNTLKLLEAPDSGIENSMMESVKKEIINGMNDGKQYSLVIYCNEDKPIRFVNTNTKEVVSTHTWNEGSGHALKITGINNNGLITSTWGRRCIVPFSDLEKAGNFYISKVDFRVK